MPSWINKASVYTLAWCLYNTQGIVLPEGCFFSQILVMALLLFSLYYIFIANTRYKLPIYFYGLNLLLGMFFVYGIYLMIGGYNPSDYVFRVPSFNYLKSILISLAPIYPFYVFSREGLITEKFIRIFFFVIFGLTVAKYYENYRKQLLLAMLIGSDSEEFTNNVAYEFLALIPFGMFFYKKPIVQYFALGTCLVFLLAAMKRGAILIGVFCLIWFLWNNLNNVSLKKKLGILALSMALCFVGYIYVEKKMEESLYFQKRVEDTLEGYSSQRDKLYVRFADYYWNEATPLHFVLGTGANATLKVGTNYAHNDWLEIAVNQGLLGILMFSIYWIFFIKTILSVSIKCREKFVLEIIMFATFMMTFFSMSYTCVGYVTGLVLGYCLSQGKKNEQINYSN